MAAALPPGPELPAAVQGVVFARDPVGVLLRCRRRFGPVFTLRFAGVGPAVVVAAPDQVHDLIRADPGAAHAGEARRAILPQASPSSSFGADAAQHDRARGRIEPALAPARIERLSGEIAAIGERHIDAWPTGAPIRVLSRMRTLTEEIFVRLVLGVEDSRRGSQIAAAVGRLLRTPGNPPLLPPRSDQGIAGRLVDRAFRRRLAPLAALLTEEIEARRRSPAGAEGIIAHVLSADPSADSGRIVDELVVVLAAAQEPPSIALTWIAERLSRDRELGERFLAADHGSATRTAIVDETLRLRPPALACLRRLTAERVVAGHRLAPHTDVIVAIPLVHRDPALFDDPQTFRADRFLDSPPPAQFIPFGDGNRGCPGEDLARAEIDTLLPVLLGRLRLRFPGRPERPVQRATVLVPNRSGLAIAS